MPLSAEKKEALIKEFGSSAQDSGLPEVQVAILSTSITELTEHLKNNPKDYSTRRGLMKKVGRRRRLLNYVKKHRTPEAYKALLTKLNLRK